MKWIEKKDYDFLTQWQIDRHKEWIEYLNMTSKYYSVKPSNKPFIIYFNQPYYKKNDIIINSYNYKVRVIKVYKYNWYRKLLYRWFNIPFKYMNCIKVKPINDGK